MPIYEYQCEQCGHRSEEMRRLADPPLTVCPSCGGPYKKQVSAPAFQFKGSGWYVTDYGKGGVKPSGEGAGEKAESGAKSESSSGAAEGGKSEKSEKSDKAAPAESSGKAEKPAAG